MSETGHVIIISHGAREENNPNKGVISGQGYVGLPVKTCRSSFMKLEKK